MKRYALSLLLLLSAGLCLANEPHDVLQAFSKVEASVETGVTFRDYTRAVGELNFAYKSYLETPEAAKRPAVQRALSTAMGHYSAAAGLWNLKFAAGNRVVTSVYRDSDLWRSIAMDYPNAIKDWDHGGAASPSSGELVIDMLLPFIWRDAALSLGTAKAAAEPRK